MYLLFTLPVNAQWLCNMMLKLKWLILVKVNLVHLKPLSLDFFYGLYFKLNLAGVKVGRVIILV